MASSYRKWAGGGCGASVIAAILASPNLEEMTRVRDLEHSVFETCGPSCRSSNVITSFLVPDELTSKVQTVLRGGPTTTHPKPNLEGFTLPVTLNGPVRSFIKFFTGRGRHIYAQWYARMTRYRAIMERILARVGVPPELVYISMIESGFNPNAVSRASAVGLWQFIETTGQGYGLRRDAWVDERRDPEKSHRSCSPTSA